MAKLILSDDEFLILLEILNSMPEEHIRLTDLAGLRYDKTLYLMPEEIELLLEEMKYSCPNERWKAVLNKFVAFKNRNVIVTG